MRNWIYLYDEMSDSRTGEGLWFGEKAAKYIKNCKGPRMYWIATAGEIIVNSKTTLAWKRERWKDFLSCSWSSSWRKYSGSMDQNPGLGWSNLNYVVTLEDNEDSRPPIRRPAWRLHRMSQLAEKKWKSLFQEFLCSFSGVCGFLGRK